MQVGQEVNSIEELRGLFDPAALSSFKKGVHSKRFKKPRKLSIGRRLLTVRSKNVVKKLAIEEPLHRENIYFVVIGKPFGYYSLGMKPNWTRMKKYHTYKKLVCRYAELSGVKLPLIATKKNPVLIHTKAYFENGVHSDPENVRKGIVDALFYSKEKRGNGDKYCGGSHELPMYDKENPRVEIIIEFPNSQQGTITRLN